MKYLMVIFILVCVNSISQTCEWAVSIHGGRQDIISNIVFDKDDNFYACGQSSSPKVYFDNLSADSIGPFSIFLAKYNKDGEAIWLRTISGEDAEIGAFLAIDSTGNIILSGSYESDILRFNDDIILSNDEVKGIGYDAFIAKYTPDGDCLWAKRIWGNQHDYISNTQTDKSGNIYVGGHSTSEVIFFDHNTSFKKTAADLAYLAKYNSDGQLSWWKVFTGAGYSGDNLKSITISENGFLYITGDFQLDAINFGNEVILSNIYQDFQTDVFVVKYDLNGYCYWARKIAGTGNDAAQSIIVDKNENVFVAGNFYSDTLVFSNSVSIRKNIKGNSFSEIYYAKYSSNGDLVFAEKIYGRHSQMGGSENNITRLQLYKNNDILFSGYTTSSKVIFNNQIDISTSPIYKAYFGIMNNNGKVQWVQKLGGNQKDWANGVFIDSQNNYFVTGWFNSDTLYFNNGISISNKSFLPSFMDSYIAKFNTSHNNNYYGIGDFDKIYKDTSCENETYTKIGFVKKSTREYLPFFTNILVYPNPVTSALNLTDITMYRDDYEYLIVDLNGNILMSGKFKNSINVDLLPSGSYTIIIFSDNFREKLKFIKN